MARIPLRVLRAARAHHSQLAGLDATARRRVVRVLNAASRRMERRIEAGEFPWESTQLTQSDVAYLATATSTDAREAFSALVLDFIRRSRFMGLGHVEGEVEAWFRYFSLAPRTLHLGVLARLDETTLIARIPSSIATWGAAVESSVRRELTASMAAREQREATVDGVKRAIQAERWKADRIVRTEMSDAYNGTHLEGLKAARDMHGMSPKKSAIVTFDARTGSDSYPMHGQIRELDENFIDGEGRRFLHPPGRPNDREKEIVWFDDSDDLQITREDGIKRAEELRKAQQADQARRRQPRRRRETQL